MNKYREMILKKMKQKKSNKNINHQKTKVTEENSSSTSIDSKGSNSALDRSKPNTDKIPSEPRKPVSNDSRSQETETKPLDQTKLQSQTTSETPSSSISVKESTSKLPLEQWEKKVLKIFGDKLECVVFGKFAVIQYIDNTYTLVHLTSDIPVVNYAKDQITAQLIGEFLNKKYVIQFKCTSRTELKEKLGESEYEQLGKWLKECAKNGFKPFVFSS